MGKEFTCYAGDTGDVGLISGSGRYPGEGMGTPSSILAWRIPWTEEPGRPQSIGSQRGGHDCKTEYACNKLNAETDSRI